MKYSKLFGRSNKGAKELDSISATLLLKGGFIDQTMAGVYTYLPLGFRVLQKIENIVREEMDEISQELFLSAMAPYELWQQTDRLEAIDVLFKISGANEKSKKLNPTEYILNPTHEEIITPIAKKFNLSYKDLPFSVYQIQTKFRNEARPKSGVMRTREFRMKDLYSFHRDEQDLKKFYDVVKEAYIKVFDRLGIGKDTYFVAASGGDFTKDYSHEFQTKCEAGEDLIFWNESKKFGYNREVAPSKAKDFKQDDNIKPLEEIFGADIVGVDDLCKFMNIKPYQTTKTIIYDSNKGLLVASVRGDYDVNEYKLMKIAGVEWLQFADEKQVKKVTGAIIGYAGICNLPKDIPVYLDDSTEALVNFETGGNKTNYHNANVNWGRDVARPEKYFDIKLAKEGDLDPETGEEYVMFKASEVGNIFPLNTKFTKAINYTFTDKDGTAKPIFMGSYGLGTTRVMGVIVEKFHDDKGIIWPENIAPYKIHLIHLGEEFKKEAEKLYNDLIKKGIEVLWDDREDVTAGAKFNDADLIGIPIRVVISKKSMEMGGVEVKLRNSDQTEVISAPVFFKKYE
ncbi:proline--tRNA ligase [Candidatus Dojkabacteria bacterium]|nr:proline--tRNA ligase [Candidatus Dojkabacteria bacterium]